MKLGKKVNEFIDSKGFTLLEVMIALTIFALFATAFLMSQGMNIEQSTRMQTDVNLIALAESKMNEMILDKPQFSNATDKQVIEKNFEEEGLKHFQYKIEYKKIKIPQIAEMLGFAGDDAQAENQNNGVDNNQSNQVLQKQIFKTFQRNIENMLWQIQITIINTNNNQSFTVARWISNEEALIDTNFNQ